MEEITREKMESIEEDLDMLLHSFEDAMDQQGHDYETCPCHGCRAVRHLLKASQLIEELLQ